jgi:hypothetical protein
MALGVMHPFESLNSPKARLIDVHSETFTLERIGVASRRIIVVDELTTTFDTNVILFTFLLAVLTDMSGSTLRTLHCRLPLIHTSIMQRRISRVGATCLLSCFRGWS